MKKLERGQAQSDMAQNTFHVRFNLLVVVYLQERRSSLI